MNNVKHVLIVKPASVTQKLITAFVTQHGSNTNVSLIAKTSLSSAPPGYMNNVKHVLIVKPASVTQKLITAFVTQHGSNTNVSLIAKTSLSSAPPGYMNNVKHANASGVESNAEFLVCLKIISQFCNQDIFYFVKLVGVYNQLLIKLYTCKFELYNKM